MYVENIKSMNNFLKILVILILKMQISKNNLQFKNFDKI